ncbi:hypothetical protein D9V37_19245 [Nocardioides mangrovicus]|uniref:Uncharacterized protein n=1 Tax=Nocardioides mangrovicus TaxID=2478913 RepID=A0A3L8P072_9ACTN|nr:hypothetical protein [Nocardioides mangrovicus]RLV48203.1 hypothetical protein D9V37_19245 [Nocardioides mangrovicus]
MTLTVPAEKTVTAFAADPSQARDRATRSVGGIAKLFAARPELRGVLASADLADDNIRWSA